jgi:hypothetical protein
MARPLGRYTYVPVAVPSSIQEEEPMAKEEPNEGTGRDIIKPLENAPMPRTMVPQRQDVRVPDDARQQRLPSKPEKP